MPRPTNEMPESRIFSFIDNKYNHVIHFFEGQKLIHDLIMTHELKKDAFSYFRDSVLGVELLTALLKPGETLGVFVDSEDPYFRLKIETNHSGQTRALVYPEKFSHSAQTIDGRVRLAKLTQNNPTPYNSVLELKQSSTKDILNIVLKQSYQVEANIIISDQSDQSIMLFRLPLMSEKIANRENISQVDISPSEYWIKMQTLINKLFVQGTTDADLITNTFLDAGLTFLDVKEVKLNCSCSRDRMVQGVKSLVQSHTLDEIFEVGKDQLESRCDYCRTNYKISRSEVLS